MDSELVGGSKWSKRQGGQGGKDKEDKDKEDKEEKWLGLRVGQRVKVEEKTRRTRTRRTRRKSGWDSELVGRSAPGTGALK